MSIELKLAIFAAMLFFHIFDDFYLQGVLANMKQKKWWRDNIPGKMYSDDYKMALFVHAFSWSFVMSSPLFVYAIYLNNSDAMLALFCFYILNTFFHMLIDNCKANLRTINLVADQSFHMMQVFFTWIFITSLFK